MADVLKVGASAPRRIGKAIDVPHTAGRPGSLDLEGIWLETSMHIFQALEVVNLIPQRHAWDFVMDAMSDLEKLDGAIYVNSDPIMIIEAMQQGCRPITMQNILDKQHSLGEQEKEDHQSLVRSKDKIDATDRMGSTVVHHAAIEGMKDLVESSLKRQPLLRNRVDKLDRTALHIAALVGDSDMVKLLADPADIDAQDLYDKTALAIAAENGHTGIVGFLIEQGANPDSVDMIHNTPLLLAVRAKQVNTVKMILSKNVNVNHQNKLGATPVHFATVFGGLEIIRILVDKGAKPNLVDKMDRTPLMLAVLQGDTEMCDFFLRKYRTEDVRKADERGYQSIHYAVRTGNMKALELLFNYKADAYATSLDGKTPLHLAAATGNVSMATLLVETANVDANAADKDGKTPLHLAAAAGDVPMATLLVETAKVDVNAADKDGMTPLLIAVVRQSENIVMFLLREAHADANTSEKNGITPLMLAVFAQNVRLVTLLLEEGKSDINLADKRGITPLRKARATGNKEMVNLLLIRGANDDDILPDKMQNTPMILAKRMGDTGVIHLLKQFGGLELDVPTQDASAIEGDIPSEAVGSMFTVTSGRVGEPHNVKTRDQRPIFKRTEANKMVSDLQRLLSKAGPEALTQKNTVFCQRNFAMAVIGPKGGRLKFADGSVTMSVPPGALSDTRVISCFRPLSSEEPRKKEPRNWVFFASELICGPDGTTFHKPITIRFQHSFHVSEDGNCKGELVKVVTKGDKHNEWSEEEEAVQFDGRWATVNIDHFTRVNIGTQPTMIDETAVIDVLVSTSLTVEGMMAAAQAMPPNLTPTILHVLMTHDQSKMQDVKEERKAANKEMISAINEYISIRPLYDIIINEKPQSFQFSENTAVLVSWHQEDNEYCVVKDIRIRRSDAADSNADLIIILEFDQTDGTSKTEKEYFVRRSDHPGMAPQGELLSGLCTYELESKRRSVTVDTTRRGHIDYPVQVECIGPPRHPLEVAEVEVSVDEELALIGQQNGLLVAEYDSTTSLEYDITTSPDADA